MAATRPATTPRLAGARPPPALATDARGIAAFAAEHGVTELAAGRDGDLRRLVAVARAAGAAGAANLLVPHVVLPAALLGAEAAGGELTTALGEGEEDLDLTGTGCQLSATAGALTLDGVKPLVTGALDVASALVSARLDGRVALARVDLAAAGVARTPVATIDRGADADLRFTALPVEHDDVLDADATRTRFARAATLATLVQAAEGAGMIDRLLELSLEQGRERHAFGRPVGSFQSFQHACADIAMERELADTLLDHAAVRGVAADAARARAFIGAAAVRAARAAIQLQGGKGFLDDHEAARLHRLAKVSQVRWGSTRWHLRTIAQGLTDRSDATSALLAARGR